MPLTASKPALVSTTKPSGLWRVFGGFVGSQCGSQTERLDERSDLRGGFAGGRLRLIHDVLERGDAIERRSRGAAGKRGGHVGHQRRHADQPHGRRADVLQDFAEVDGAAPFLLRRHHIFEADGTGGRFERRLRRLVLS